MALSKVAFRISSNCSRGLLTGSAVRKSFQGVANDLKSSVAVARRSYQSEAKSAWRSWEYAQKPTGVTGMIQIKADLPLRKIIV